MVLCKWIFKYKIIFSSEENTVHVFGCVAKNMTENNFCYLSWTEIVFSYIFSHVWFVNKNYINNSEFDPSRKLTNMYYTPKLTYRGKHPINIFIIYRS